MTVPGAAMIFAAGFGTRMGALTRDRPKPLLPVGPTTLIDHTLDQVAEAGIGRAVVNLHYRGAMIRQHLAGRTRPAIAFSQEHPDILDTGGGLVHALEKLAAATVATVNADTVFVGANPFAILVRNWEPEVMDALLLLVPVTRTLGYSREGDFFLDGPGGVPVRRGAADRAPFVYAGAQIIKARALDEPPAGPFSLNVIWNRLLERGRLRAAIYPDGWVDVGTPEGLVLADRALGCPA